MNGIFVLGLIVGGILAGVYAAARQAIGAAAERVEPRAPNPPRAILADCAACGRTIQDRHGRCASCGSSSIWTLGVAVPEPSEAQIGATLARVAFLADVKGRAITRNETARRLSSRRVM